jgi:hypothetical protein
MLFLVTLVPPVLLVGLAFLSTALLASLLEGRLTELVLASARAVEPTGLVAAEVCVDLALELVVAAAGLFSVTAVVTAARFCLAGVESAPAVVSTGAALSAEALSAKPPSARNVGTTRATAPTPRLVVRGRWTRRGGG